MRTLSNYIQPFYEICQDFISFLEGKSLKGTYEDADTYTWRLFNKLTYLKDRVKVQKELEKIVGMLPRLDEHKDDIIKILKEIQDASQSDHFLKSPLKHQTPS